MKNRRRERQNRGDLESGPPSDLGCGHLMRDSAEESPSQPPICRQKNQHLSSSFCLLLEKGFQCLDTSRLFLCES